MPTTATRSTNPAPTARSLSSSSILLPKRSADRRWPVGDSVSKRLGVPRPLPSPQRILVGHPVTHGPFDSFVVWRLKDSECRAEDTREGTGAMRLRSPRSQWGPPGREGNAGASPNAICLRLGKRSNAMAYLLVRLVLF